MSTIIGTCSLCGGPVGVPSVWMGIVPPIPRCGHCGATPKASFGPVLDMQRPEQTVSNAGVDVAELLKALRGKDST